MLQKRLRGESERTRARAEAEVEPRAPYMPMGAF